MTELGDDRLHVFRQADDGDDVAGLRRGLVSGHGQRAAVPDAAEGDGRRVAQAQLSESGNWALDDDAPRDDRLELRAPPLQHHLDGEQRQQHAERIAQRIPDDRRSSHGRGRVLQRLEQRGERGRVRLAAGEGSGDRAACRAREDVDQEGGARCGAEGRHDDGVGADASPPEDADETGPARQAGRVDEDGEPEHPDRLRHYELRVERPEHDAGEEHGRDPEREPVHAHARSQHADGRDDEDEEDGVVLEDVHALSVAAVPPGRIGGEPQRGFGLARPVVVAADGGVPPAGQTEERWPTRRSSPAIRATRS